MPDNFTHQFNARNALKIADYEPRNINAFIIGANGPDPLFCYKMYNPFRKYHLSGLASRMHKEQTGLFLQNLFRCAKTDTQKDYCLGFLCHYSLDSIMHPYVEYVTTTYSMPYNIPSGHQYFEGALDSQISYRFTGRYAASTEAYCPDIKRTHLEQIARLFKQAAKATYTDIEYPLQEYIQAFKDFKFIKQMFYSPNRWKNGLAFVVEKLLRFDEGFVVSHMQPCKRKIEDVPVWCNYSVNILSTATIAELLKRADYMSADYIKVGLEYFKGVYSAQDLLEDIGNKSYETGVTIS